MKGFQMTLETAQRFYERCIEKKAVTEEERLAVMNELIHEEDIKILTDKRLKKALKGKNLLRVKESPSNG